MTHDERIAELEALLREEREFRQAAESRVQALTEKAELWRGRAEERSERIDRLIAESELPGVRRLASRVRRSLRTESEAPPPAITAGTLPHCLPVYPSIRVAAAVADPGISACLATADAISLADPETSLVDADLVVVEPAAHRKLGDGVRARLAEWATLDGRRPLVVWTSGDTVRSELLRMCRERDVVATTRAGAAAALGRSLQRPVAHLPATLDPLRHMPGSAAAPVGLLPEDGATVHGTESSPSAVTVAPAMLGDPPGWLVALAATGVPVVPEPAWTGSAPATAGAAAVRWAYRSHAPWVRLARLLELAGVAAPDPTPTVSLLLVSRRPDAVPAAIERMAAQTHRPLELVVGIHGGSVTSDIAAALDRSGLPATTVELDSGLTLGECLNLAAAASTGSILAKIDDDDHYGPGYIEDGVHALHYSGAGVVTKAAQFTYLAARDETVLRRARQEHVFLDGTTQGATFVMHRGVWQAVRFPHRTRGEDLRFLRGVRVLGEKVYAGSRWEFCYVRQAGHTWTAADETFLAGAKPAWGGFEPHRVEVADLG